MGEAYLKILLILAPTSPHPPFPDYILLTRRFCIMLLNSFTYFGNILSYMWSLWTMRKSCPGVFRKLWCCRIIKFIVSLREIKFHSNIGFIFQFFTTIISTAFGADIFFSFACWWLFLNVPMLDDDNIDMGTGRHITGEDLDMNWREIWYYGRSLPWNHSHLSFNLQREKSALVALSIGTILGPDCFSSPHFSSLNREVGK